MARDAATHDVFWEDDFGWEGPGRVAAPPRPRRARTSAPRPRRAPGTSQPARRRRPAPAARRRAARRAQIRRRRAIALAVVVVLVVGLVVMGRLGGSAPSAAPEHHPPTGSNATPPAGKPAADALAVQPGGSGPNVRALQAALAALGYLQAAPDGGYGPATRRAVAAFQRASALSPSGRADDRTAAALAHALDARTTADAGALRHALTRAGAAGRIPAAEAAHDRVVVRRALRSLRGLDVERRAAMAAVLHTVAQNAPGLDAGRARTLVDTLAVNAAYLARHAPPVRGTEVVAPDGVVYRAFPPHGLQFHPLASFGALNRAVTKHRAPAAHRLADALVARALHEHGALVWEYEFPFGGPSRWRSGFVQAVAADALARAAAMTHDRSLRQDARAALRAIPDGLDMRLGGGLWIREYSQSTMPILNAQLQTLVSVLDYARVSKDPAARALARKLDTAARTLLPRFDTGCWSLYSLGGQKASRHYHAYHVALLKQLALTTADPTWARMADRWARDLNDPSAGCPA